MEASQPSGWQKSFCMSTTTIAVLARSSVSVCGLAVAVTGEDGAGSRRRSTEPGPTPPLFRAAPRRMLTTPRFSVERVTAGLPGHFGRLKNLAEGSDGAWLIQKLTP